MYIWSGVGGRSCEEWGLIASALGFSLALAHRSEEQSELCLKGDDTHRNVNGAEYFRGRIITWQKEDGWVSRKHLVVEVALCYCKPGVKDDFNARLTRPSCCRVALRWLSPPPPALITFWKVKACWNFKASQVESFFFSSSPHCLSFFFPPPNVWLSFPFI